MKKHLAATFMSAVMLVPSMTSAREPGTVTLGVYEAARHDPAKQSRMFKDAYEWAVASTLVALRDAHFTDGKTKTPQRLERDKARATRIENMVGHLTDKQLDDLVNLIATYADAQPNTKLEDVIVSFLLREADKQPNQAGESAVPAPNK